MPTETEIESATMGVMPHRRSDLAHDLILPTLLFAALGGMTWAVRGCTGFGAVIGCVFAGVMWGVAWWYIAQDPDGEPSRRYSSGWIVLALTVGIGLAGGRGWMQWPSFFEGRLQTNAGKGEFLPISKSYGFLWLFIAGVPWAGLGACMLAWCGSRRETRVWHWILRIACGIGGGLLFRYIYTTFPHLFLPLYDTYRDRYQDLDANPNLRRLYNDCNGALTHLGYYCGFLAFELVRREWKNVVLILTVGLLNGAGWAICQNWKWARGVWPNDTFNWWRAWESSGGLSIGFALGIAYFLVNRPMSDREKASVMVRRSIVGPNFEWLLVFTGLTYLLSVSLGTLLGGQRGSLGWGAWDYTAALGFGLLYYLWNRGKPAGIVDAHMKPAPVVVDPATDPFPGVAPAGIGTALVAVLVVGSTIALMFPEVTRHILPEGQGGRGSWRYLMGYEAAVMAIGLAWYWLNRAACDAEKDLTTPIDGDINLERFGVYAGILLGLGVSIANGAKGWFNIYRTETGENEWLRWLWNYLGPAYLAILVLAALWILVRPMPRTLKGRGFPHAYALTWLVLIVQNVIAQLITGPVGDETAMIVKSYFPAATPDPKHIWLWDEAAYAIYYLLLFFITAIIVIHYHTMKKWRMIA